MDAVVHHPSDGLSGHKDSRQVPDRDRETSGAEEKQDTKSPHANASHKTQRTNYETEIKRL